MWLKLKYPQRVDTTSLLHHNYSREKRLGESGDETTEDVTDVTGVRNGVTHKGEESYLCKWECKSTLVEMRRGSLKWCRLSQLLATSTSFWAQIWLPQIKERLNLYLVQRVFRYNNIQIQVILRNWLQIMIFQILLGFRGLSWWLSPLRNHLQCRRLRFDSWFWKIPWRRAWQLTLVFLPGESQGLRSPTGYIQTIGSQVGHNWSNWAHTHTHTLIFRRIFNISIFEYKFRQDLTESELSEARLLPACLTTLCSSSFQDLAGGLGYRINLGYKAETK